MARCGACNVPRRRKAGVGVGTVATVGTRHVVRHPIEACLLAAGIENPRFATDALRCENEREILDVSLQLHLLLPLRRLLAPWRGHNHTLGTSNGRYLIAC